MDNLPIIVDTDPGIDDAVALAVLWKCCKNRIKLIVSSYGNISVELTTKNTLAILELLEADVPVVQGIARPDNPRYVSADHIHGADGLGGLCLQAPSQKTLTGDPFEILRETILSAGMVDYITLGPLTNLAVLLKRFPDLLLCIRNVVTMGGSIQMGNVTPYAEFNIHCDAQSANYVFSKINALTLVPLNVTTPVAFGLPAIAEIGQAGTPLSCAMEKILTANYHACIAYGEPGSVMHDATAALCYLKPSLFGAESCGIQVTCKGTRYGETTRTSGRNIALVQQADPSVILAEIRQNLRL